MKSASVKLYATLRTERKPKKANPSKGGDAKRWACRHKASDYGRQAAEEHLVTASFLFFNSLLQRAWLVSSPFCFEPYKRIVPIKANLSKGRDAKPWVYRRAPRDHDSQAAEDEPPEPGAVTREVWMLAGVSHDIQTSDRVIKKSNPRCCDPRGGFLRFGASRARPRGRTPSRISKPAVVYPIRSGRKPRFPARHLHSRCDGVSNCPTARRQCGVCLSSRWRVDPISHGVRVWHGGVACP